MGVVVTVINEKLPQYYWLECKFINGNVSKYVATWKIISDLYERAYKECQQPKDSQVLAIGPPRPYSEDLITREQKLMILGSGRSGTTFLVKLLTRLGLYTGYFPYEEIDMADTRGGCEFGIFSLGEVDRFPNGTMTRLDETHVQKVYDEFAATAFLIKAPSYSWYAKLLVYHYEIPIGHILVPVRDHREVARSRMGEGLQLPIIGSDHDSQVIACDVLLGKTVETAVLADIPMTFTRFPDIVMDEEYCWSKLNSILLGTFDIQLDREHFREEF